MSNNETTSHTLLLTALERFVYDIAKKAALEVIQAEHPAPEPEAAKPAKPEAAKPAKPAAKPAPKKAAATKKAAPVEEPEDDEDDPFSDAPKPTKGKAKAKFDNVEALIAAARNAHQKGLVTMDVIKDALIEYGVTQIADIEPEDFDGFYTSLGIEA